MQDPIMQSILQQAQGDPAALQEHMKNPGIRAKVSNTNGKFIFKY
jgi:stress-induced-phosphoprotein 1